MPRTSKQTVIERALKDIVEVDRETALVIFQGLDGYLMGEVDPDDDAQTKRQRTKAKAVYDKLRELLAAPAA